MRIGSNSRIMQQNNRAIVLKIISGCDSQGGLSRKEIAVQTGLSSATVTNITGDLMSEGYIIEAGEGKSSVGRKPIQLKLNRDKHSIIGVELSANFIICTICDFGGNIITKGSMKHSGGIPVKETIDRVWSLAKKLLSDKKLSQNNVLGIGLMTSGPHDREEGALLNPPNFTGEGWLHAPVRKLLEEKSGLPVLLDRDSVGCVLAEVSSENTDLNQIMFAVMVNSVGIGGGITVGGEVLYGNDDSAAEIGHVTVIQDGPLCGCGDKGCLEAVSSGEAIAKALTEQTGKTVTIEELISLYRSEDIKAVNAVENGAKYLGMAISNIIKCVNPQILVLGGEFISLFPEYYDLAYGYAMKRRYITIGGGTQVNPFTYGEIQCAMGGVQLVLNNFYSDLVN